MAAAALSFATSTPFGGARRALAETPSSKTRGSTPAPRSSPTQAPSSTSRIANGVPVLEVRITRAGVLTEVRLEGRRARLRSTAGGIDRSFDVSSEQADVLRASARLALADPAPHTKCLNGETWVGLSLGDDTASTAICDGSTRLDDARWTTLVALLRALTPPPS